MSARRLAAVSAVIALGLLALTVSGRGVVPPARADAEIIGGPLRYRVVASRPRLNRKVLGPVQQFVHGVPAAPVDSFVYDGDGSIEIAGQIVIEVDPVGETGLVTASWTDPHGDWTYTQDRFLHPEHFSGVRLGTTIAEVDRLINEGITDNVYLHGDTAAGMPVLPTLFSFLAAWGPADVTRDRRSFENPFGLPAPQWLGHVMVTEGVRLPDGTVRGPDDSIYDPQHPGAGAVERGDLEVHLTFHPERSPTPGNFPPLFAFFYHLVFEDVAIQIVEAEETIVIEEPDEDALTRPEPIRPRRVPLRR